MGTEIHPGSVRATATCCALSVGTRKWQVRISRRHRNGGVSTRRAPLHGNRRECVAVASPASNKVEGDFRGCSRLPAGRISTSATGRNGACRTPPIGQRSNSDRPAHECGASAAIPRRRTDSGRRWRCLTNPLNGIRRGAIECSPRSVPEWGRCLESKMIMLGTRPQSETRISSLRRSLALVSDTLRFTLPDRRIYRSACPPSARRTPRRTICRQSQSRVERGSGDREV